MTDFSKAPDGATHYDKAWFYRRFDDGSWYYHAGTKGWKLCPPPDHCECAPIPKRQAESACVSRLQYKGFLGVLVWDIDKDSYFGKIDLHIGDNGQYHPMRDLVTFESDKPGQLVSAFESAVDEYLADCKELGKTPGSAEPEPAPTNPSPAAGAEPGTTNAMIDSTLQERGKRYGTFSGHAMISQSLKAVMQETRNWQRLAPDQREALEMIQHKIGRILNGDPDYADSWHDIAGYASLIDNRLCSESA